MSRTKSWILSLVLGACLLPLPAWAGDASEISCQNPKILDSIQRILAYRGKNLEKARRLLEIAKTLPVEKNSALATRIAATEAAFGRQPNRQLASPLGRSEYALDRAVHGGRGPQVLEDIFTSHLALRRLVNAKIAHVLARKKAARLTFHSPTVLMDEYLRANQSSRKLVDQAIQHFFTMCREADYVERAMIELQSSRPRLATVPTAGAAAAPETAAQAPLQPQPPTSAWFGGAPAVF